MAVYEWVIGPLVRAKDALSVGAVDYLRPVAEADKDAATAVLYSDYTFTNSVGTISGREENTLPIEIENEGYSVICNLWRFNNLPDGYIFNNFSIVSFFPFYMNVTGSTANYTTKLWIKYVHSFLGLSLGVGWNFSKIVNRDFIPGVTLGLNFQTREYGFPIIINTADYY